MTTDCGCDQVNDRESWHRYRQLPLCDDARDYQRDRSRRKYAQRLAREGRTVKPGHRRSTWIPGTDVAIPEEDPL